MITKKKVVTILVVFFAIGIIVILAGPRIAVETKLFPVHLPADLDGYIVQSEAQYANIVAGAEKSIVWANTANKQKTEYVVVFVHGFSATRQEIAPVCDILAKKIEANLFYTRLRGHGRDVEAMMGDYREWKPRNALEEKYWTYRYRIEVIYAMMGLVDMVDHLDLSEMKIPVLVIHSDRDQVISVEKLKERYQEIGSKMKKRVTVNNTQDEWGHIMAGDIISPKTTGTVVTSIMNFLSLMIKGTSLK